MSSSVPTTPIDYKALVQDDRIHASLYTDPRIFDDERERIFHRGWVFVGHDSEIPRPGDFVTRHVGTEPVIMVRGKDGAVSVLVNRACTGERWCAPPIAVTRGRSPVRITAGRMRYPASCSACHIPAAMRRSTRART